MDELDDLRRRVDTLEERNRLALLMAWAGIVLHQQSGADDDAALTAVREWVDDPGSVEKWEAAFDALSATLWTHPELRQPADPSPLNQAQSGRADR